MSDFDTVLERLLTDPTFKAALAANPAAALAGYRLTPDEVDLLRSQVSTDRGAERTVETRTSKASMAGLLGSFEGLAAAGPGSGSAEHFSAVGRGLGAGQHGGPSQHFGAIGQPTPGHQTSGLGPVASASDPYSDGVPLHGGEPFPGGGPFHGTDPYGTDPYGAGVDPYGGTGEAGGGAGYPSGPLDPAMSGVVGSGDHPATGYHPHIDADGDGHWDHYTAVRHADGSVDVYEDRNGDGLADFVGHDRNGDGILESADYDEDRDGVLDTHMVDTNGDGWMDTRGPEPHGK
jgi:hypothetical protein